MAKKLNSDHIVYSAGIGLFASSVIILLIAFLENRTYMDVFEEVKSLFAIVIFSILGYKIFFD